MDGLIQATKDGDQSKFQALSGPETLVEEDDEVIEDTVDEDEDEVHYLFIVCAKLEKFGSEGSVVGTT